MGLSGADAILDIMRGLSSLTALTIVTSQLKHIHDSFFVAHCSHCRGTGIVTCPHCKGSKLLRRRSGNLRVRDLGISDSPKDQYPCFHCGKFSIHDFYHDFKKFQEDRFWMMRDNLEQRVAGLPQAYQLPPTAGTVKCPNCHGRPVMNRITPNFGQAFNMDESWDFKIAKRCGRLFMGPEDRPADRKRLFFEYGHQPPVARELPLQRHYSFLTTKEAKKNPRNKPVNLPTSGLNNEFRHKKKVMVAEKAFSKAGYKLPYWFKKNLLGPRAGPLDDPLAPADMMEQTDDDFIPTWANAADKRRWAGIDEFEMEDTALPSSQIMPLRNQYRGLDYDDDW